MRVQKGKVASSADEAFKVAKQLVDESKRLLAWALKLERRCFDLLCCQWLKQRQKSSLLRPRFMLVAVARDTLTQDTRAVSKSALDPNGIFPVTFCLELICTVICAALI